MAPRTLQEHLQAQGRSFQQIRDAARAAYLEQWAVEWGHTSAPVPTNSDIDKMLGFDS